MRSLKWGVSGVVGILWTGIAAGLLAAAPPYTGSGGSTYMSPAGTNYTGSTATNGVRTLPRQGNALHVVPNNPTEGVIDAGKVELVTERYPNGKVKIEREVGQDAAGNYVNQGSYKFYNLAGEVVKSGEFFSGKQIGKWTQTFTKDEGQLFSCGQEGEFLGPFTSEATFQEGRLHGAWTITDAQGQKIIQWFFDNDARSGTWTWLHPNGQKRLEATYRNGLLNGDVQEWDREGKLLSQTSYVDGQSLVKSVQWYTLGQKHFEGSYLHAQSTPTVNYDWWNSKLTIGAAPAAGPDQRHGVWTEWYRNGNKKAEGQYDHDVATGKFTWWYENGQTQAEGDYETGQKTGTWVTWHPNGLKESLGEFKDGKLVTKWLHWSEDGKVSEVEDRDAPSTTVASGLQMPGPNTNRGGHGYTYRTR
jgi:antitoxin component YwqK of YwqJK toxin-antitoxin module